MIPKLVLLALLAHIAGGPAFPAENLKANCDRGALAAALRQAAVVASGSEREAGRRVRIAAADGLILSATDGVVGVRIQVPGARVQNKGEVVVQASALASVVESVRGGIVEIEAADPFLIVTAPGATSRIRTVFLESFPVLSGFEESGSFQVKTAELSRMIRQTVFAAVRDPASRIPACVLWEVAGGKLSLAATDGKRLALADGEVASPAKDMKAVAPLRLMSLLAEYLPKSGGPAGIWIGETEIRIKAGASVWSGALVQSPFPDVRALIPRPSETAYEVTRSDFASALKAAVAIAEKADQAVRFTPAEGGVLIKTETSEGWTSSVFLEARLKGSPVLLGFNAKYLLDWLEVMDEGSLTIEISGRQRPLVCRLPGFLYLLMPAVW